MRNSSKFTLKGKAKDSYLDLITAFPLVSLRSASHLQAAQQVMDRLLAKPKREEGEELYLDALSDLVATYEDEHYKIRPASDADTLRHFMDAKQVNQADIHRDTGIPKSSISEVLAGKRPLTRLMIRKLSRYFNVAVTVLAGNL
jgi:HTH-type transcriptional regulator / antitoxin HigA